LVGIVSFCSIKGIYILLPGRWEYRSGITLCAISFYREFAFSMVLTRLIELIKCLMEEKFTGQIVINFHNGDMSEKLDKVHKESVNLI